MKIDKELITRFEAQLNPQDPSRSQIPVKVVGYGEISAIFQINHDQTCVYKRMPLFKTRQTAEDYQAMYREYCGHLQKAGLNLPEDATAIVETKNRPVTLYIAQQGFPAASFCHKQIHDLGDTEAARLIRKVADQIKKVWVYNRLSSPSVTLALDGQLSNWVCVNKGNEEKLYYVDTSTPLIQKNGVEQLDPELMLQSAPGFLRWIIRLFFLSDVMERYYDLNLVYTDLAGNLYKEQRKELIPEAIQIMNSRLENADPKLTLKQIESYYKEDKIIWSLFLFFRRVDCFIKTRLLGRRYEFMLPGKIRR
jgi:hypothetical protein